MKKLITTLALTATLSFSAIASDDKESNTVCAGYSELAQKIMEMRQDNMSMASMYDALKHSNLSITILKEAYKIPLYSVESNKLKAVNEFKNDVFLACIGV